MLPLLDGSQVDDGTAWEILVMLMPKESLLPSSEQIFVTLATPHINELMP